MTVAELIEKLQEMPKDMDVYIYDWDCGMIYIDSVSIKKHDLFRTDVVVIQDDVI